MKDVKKVIFETMIELILLFIITCISMIIVYMLSGDLNVSIRAGFIIFLVSVTVYMLYTMTRY